MKTRINNSTVRSSPRIDDGYDHLMDILAEMRSQGVAVPPVLRNLTVQLLKEAKEAQDETKHLISKYTHLQAEHTQLALEFNHYCEDDNKGWQDKSKESLCDDMRRSVDAANASSHKSREETKRMFTEHLVMTNELATLRAEVAQLRKENEELKEKNN
ncbi:uncharacterized protein F4822DRAFT_347861 [Hypoxylon trugodes]|uniref:uncharacterized protein n=1 Tax=Hypoxylon trugodes TaxID=326681 RepID=UPI00219E89CB|nr:uncharacterized protein F4822DRAFT_347861 [Hypoxylon trugodes]KAI1385573.1 hypothetical protein F4822DRAFT_347861 [Hypoxylon trugodes]